MIKTVMKAIRIPTWLGSTLVALLLAGCLVPPPALKLDSTIVSARRGIDPASPLAQSALLETCTPSTCAVRPLDLVTGKAVPGYAPVQLGQFSVHAFAPDGRRLAIISYRSNNLLAKGVLKFVDLPSWQIVTTTLTFDDVGDEPVFNRAGTQLAITGYGSSPARRKLYLVDIGKQTITAQATLAFGPRLVQYTPDGAYLMVYGDSNGTPPNGWNAHAHVAQLSAVDLHVEWEHSLADVNDGLFQAEGGTSIESAIAWEPAFVFAPDQTMLYIVHADEDRLTTVDFAARTAHTTSIAPKQTWLERLLALIVHPAYAKEMKGIVKRSVLSPDGKRLYVVGMSYDYRKQPDTTTFLGLQVIDIATGAQIAHLDTQAQWISLSSEGAQIFLHGMDSDPAKPYPDEWTEVIDMTGLQILTRVNQRAIIPARRLDGQPILLSSTVQQDGKTELAALNPDSLALIHAWADWYTGYVGWWAMP